MASECRPEKKLVNLAVNQMIGLRAALKLSEPQRQEALEIAERLASREWWEASQLKHPLELSNRLMDLLIEADGQSIELMAWQAPSWNAEVDRMNKHDAE